MKWNINDVIINHFKLSQLYFTVNEGENLSEENVNWIFRNIKR